MKKMTVEMIPTDMERLTPEHRALAESVDALLAEVPVTLTSFDEPTAVERTLAMDFESPYRLNGFFPVTFAEIRQAKLEGTFQKPEKPSGFIKDTLRNKAASGLISVLFGDGSTGTGISRRFANAMWKHDRDEIMEASRGQIDIERHFLQWRREGEGIAHNANGHAFTVGVEQLALEGMITVQGREYPFARTDLATTVSITSEDMRHDRTYIRSSMTPGGSCVQIRDHYKPNPPILPGQTEVRRGGLGPLEVKEVVELTQLTSAAQEAAR